MKIAELAKRYGIGRQTVLEHVRRLSLTHRYPRLGPQEVARAVELYQAGQSLAAVGDALEADPGTVRRALAKVGVSIRDPQRRPP
jgi:transposase-like protein